MSGDIFEALDSAGFGGNVREIAAEGECRVLRIDGEDGEGFMTMYRVFDGVYLMTLPANPRVMAPPASSKDGTSAGLKRPTVPVPSRGTRVPWAPAPILPEFSRARSLPDTGVPSASPCRT